MTRASGATREPFVFPAPSKHLARDLASLSVGLAFLREANKGDSFSKLSKNEGGIERGLYRALAQLQRLHAARAGQPLAPPIMVDLSVDVGASYRPGCYIGFVSLRVRSRGSRPCR